LKVKIDYSRRAGTGTKGCIAKGLGRLLEYMASHKVMSIRPVSDAI